MNDDVIFGVATGAGVSGVAIIRISGSNALDVLNILDVARLEPRVATLGNILDTETGDFVDQGLFIFFPGPNSFTGEDIIELQVHGSEAIISKTLEILKGIDNFRLAEAGEFTRRALFNEKLDLVQIEALNILLGAKSWKEVFVSQKVLRGALSKKVEHWRLQLLDCLADIEAVLDFGDESDSPDSVTFTTVLSVEALSSEISAEIQSLKKNRAIFSGFEIALIGAPNSGKSSLVNALVGRNVSIVSDISGTTRDVIEAEIEIDGIRVRFLDLAGLSKTNDEIEKIGIERAYERALCADMRIFLDGGEGFRHDGIEIRDFDLKIQSKADIRVINKSGIPVSSRTGDGLDFIVNHITEHLRELELENPIILSSRQSNLMENVLECLEIFQVEFRKGNLDICSFLLYSILNFFDETVGINYSEDILDRVFSNFCIGK